MSSYFYLSYACSYGSLIEVNKDLIECRHGGRGHDQSDADDGVAVESISVGHHDNAGDGQDRSHYLGRHNTQ